MALTIRKCLLGKDLYKKEHQMDLMRAAVTKPHEGTRKYRYDSLVLPHPQQVYGIAVA